MIESQSLLLFVTAGLLLNLTPGPDVLYIVGRSLSQGRTAGVVSALGIGTGSLFHVTAAALGLSALVLAMPLAFDVVRIAGAAYLVWLGIKALRSSAAFGVQALEQTPLAKIFRQGVLTNVLNPKVALFFLAFLPQFTNPERGRLAAQVAVLGAIFTVNGTIVCLGYALAAGRLGAWLKTRYDVSATLNRITGGLFILLGLRLVFLERR